MRCHITNLKLSHEHFVKTTLLHCQVHILTLVQFYKLWQSTWERNINKEATHFKFHMLCKSPKEHIHLYCAPPLTLAPQEVFLLHSRNTGIIVVKNWSAAPNSATAFLVDPDGREGGEVSTHLVRSWQLNKIHTWWRHWPPMKTLQRKTMENFLCFLVGWKALCWHPVWSVANWWYIYTHSGFRYGAALILPLPLTTASSSAPTF